MGGGTASSANMQPPKPQVNQRMTRARTVGSAKSVININRGGMSTTNLATFGRPAPGISAMRPYTGSFVNDFKIAIRNDQHWI